MKKISILILASALTLTSCKKEQTEEQTEEPTTETPTAIVRPEPKTTVSGTSFIDESENTYDKQFQSGSHTKEKYTVVSYTTNAKFAETEFENSVPTEDEQLLAVNIGLESLLCDGRFSGMNTSFSIHIDDKAEEIQKFTSFTPEFFKANPNAVSLDTNTSVTLKKGEKTEKVFYFVIPKDADLSKAYLTLYRGSDMEELKLPLNP
ncbi:hypothetical protein [Flavobacterium sp.]|uniref:hypothetical protein n=1 Tax=Flavobacterium sp. TaxID=239 RepID=UPI002635943E|nr:hypothetical protein [Flavobacterium sp.]